MPVVIMSKEGFFLTTTLYQSKNVDLVTTIFAVTTVYAFLCERKAKAVIEKYFCSRPARK